MYAYTCVCLGVCVCTFICVFRPEVDAGSLPPSLCLLRISCLNPELTGLVRLDRAVGFTHLYILRPRLQAGHYASWHLYRCWDSSLDMIHVCRVLYHRATWPSQQADLLFLVSCFFSSSLGYSRVSFFGLCTFPSFVKLLSRFYSLSLLVWHLSGFSHWQSSWCPL